MATELKMISNYNFSKVLNRNIKYIVIHWVGAVSTAQNNGKYFQGGNRNASAHYFVDDNFIVQSVLDKNAAWAVGSKTLLDQGSVYAKYGHKYWGICTNNNSISIEMCCYKNKDGKLAISSKTIANTTVLVKRLMKKYNVPAERVIRHFDVNGKLCPGPYIDNTKWKTLRNKLTGTTPVTTTTSTSSITCPTVNLKKGDKGSEVLKLQKCLNKVMGTKLELDSSFGPAVEKAVKDFQKKYGLEPDGSFGPASRAKMKSVL